MLSHKEVISTQKFFLSLLMKLKAIFTILELGVGGPLTTGTHLLQEARNF